MEEKDRIEKIMQQENMNSTQFALETGIQTSTLSHILNGRNKVSLEVLKKILNRFRTINSDWLILGVGSMYRQEKHSQAPTLFDFDNENTLKSVSSTSTEEPDYYTQFRGNQQKTAYTEETGFQTAANQQPILSPVVEKAPRLVKKIIVYYTDNSFQEFQAD